MSARALALVLLATGCGGVDDPGVPPTPTPPPEETPQLQADIKPTDVVMGLVQAPGRDAVMANCIACHSTALITQNRMSRQGWDDTITWMQEKQGLWPIADEPRAAILDYLQATQGVDEAGLGADSPWATPMYPPNPLW
jgi:hypothetical protein